MRSFEQNNPKILGVSVLLRYKYAECVIPNCLLFICFILRAMAEIILNKSTMLGSIRKSNMFFQRSASAANTAEDYNI